MIEVTIKKPIYGTHVAIREEILRKAIKEKTKLKVIIPQGSQVVDPRVWIDTGKRMSKVFKFPDRPMILWSNDVIIEADQASLLP